MSKDIRIPDVSLLQKHNLTLADFIYFMKADSVSYEVCYSASRFNGADLATRNMLLEQGYSSKKCKEFFDEYSETYQEVRARYLDRINDYAEEFYGRKPLGSPNGRHFW